MFEVPWCMGISGVEMTEGVRAKVSWQEACRFGRACVRSTYMQRGLCHLFIHVVVSTVVIAALDDLSGLAPAPIPIDFVP